MARHIQIERLLIFVSVMLLRGGQRTPLGGMIPPHGERSYSAPTSDSCRTMGHRTTQLARQLWDASRTVDGVTVD